MERKTKASYQYIPYERTFVKQSVKGFKDKDNLLGYPKIKSLYLILEDGIVDGLILQSGNEVPFSWKGEDYLYTFQCPQYYKQSN